MVKSQQPPTVSNKIIVNMAVDVVVLRMDNDCIPKIALRWIPFHLAKGSRDGPRQPGEDGHGPNGK